MARPVKFDRQEALEKAMMLFWSQGYAATSVQQLLDGMNISRSSMYATFGTKRDLFLEVLDRFNEIAQELVKVLSESQDPVIGVSTFFEVGFFRNPAKLTSLGCLLVNTVLEMDDVDNELCAVAACHMDNIENAFVDFFLRCKADGTLPEGHDAVTLAGFMMTLMKGMRVVVRQKTGEAYLHDIIETALIVVQNSKKSTRLRPAG